jgi:hypothetical protein
MCVCMYVHNDYNFWEEVASVVNDCNCLKKVASVDKRLQLFEKSCKGR